MTTAEARRFFNRYRDAFNRFDAEAVSDAYALPCVFSQGTELSVFETREALLVNNRRLVAMYAEDDFERANFGRLGVSSYGDSHAVVRAKWAITRSTPKPAVAFATAYNLRRSELEWKIRAVTVFEEVAAFKAGAGSLTPEAGFQV